MHFLIHVDDAVHVFEKIWKQKLISQCSSCYPAIMGKVFARAQKSISPGGNFKCVVKWIFKFSESLDVIFACHMLE